MGLYAHKKGLHAYPNNTVQHPSVGHYRSVILNRGPHGPPGGNLQVLGGNTEHLGNWGGMAPSGGNQQIAINRPGCSSGWRIVAASPVPSAQCTLKQ